MLPLVVIVAYSGMRREEVASLRAEDALGDALIVREGKTEAAAGRVPLRPVLAPFVAQIKEKREGRTFDSGPAYGRRGWERGHAIGKRFATLKSRLGFKDPALNFHTLRNAFMQHMETAEVPVSTTKLIVGHKRMDITYGTWLRPNVKVLQEAVAKVTFGPLDALVSDLAGRVYGDTEDAQEVSPRLARIARSNHVANARIK